jgi:hypothetical protein
MIAALKRIVIPDLRARGFRGSFPHFRRPKAAQIDLLTFQFDKWGGGFVIEIATCPPDGHTHPWGLFVPPNKVTAHDIDFDRRPRLGAPTGGDHWFRFDDLLPADEIAFDAVARQVLPYLDRQAEPFWRQA